MMCISRLRGLAALWTTALFAAAAMADVVGFGGNAYGQLNIPAGLGQPLQIAAGGVGFCLALRPDRTVAAWGYNVNHQCDVPADAVDVRGIAAGYWHGAAVLPDGTVRAWGNNDAHQCEVESQTNVVAIAAGGFSTIMLHRDHTVSMVGYRADSVPAGLQAKAIAGGKGFAAAIRLDGTVVAWGDNDFGQCNVPAGLTDVVAISCGWDHMLALKADGTMVGWGTNTYGESTAPAGLTDVVSISASYFSSYALRANGQVFAWGFNDEGQTIPPANVLADQLSAQGGSVFLRTSNAKLEFNRSSITGGSTAHLNAKFSLQSLSPLPTLLNLTSSDRSALRLPATVTIPAGQRSVTVEATHNAVAEEEPVTITIDQAGAITNVPVTVKPFNVLSLRIDPGRMDGESVATGTVALNAVPRAALSVPLVSTDPTYILFSARVNLRPNDKFGTFAIQSGDVPRAWSTTLTAGWSHSSQTASLTVLPLPRVQALTVSASTLRGNQSMTGTVTLNRPAGPNGVSVVVTSDRPYLLVPATVLVAPGSTMATFPVSSTDLAQATTARISGSTTYSAAGQSVKLQPMLVSAVALGKSTLSSGQHTNLTITLAGPVEVDTLVDLTAVVAGVVDLPATATVLAGHSQVSVQVTAAAVASTKKSAIRAARHDRFKAVTLTVNP